MRVFLSSLFPVSTIFFSASLTIHALANILAILTFNTLLYNRLIFFWLLLFFIYLRKEI